MISASARVVPSPPIVAAIVDVASEKTVDAEGSDATCTNPGAGVDSGGAVVRGRGGEERSAPAMNGGGSTVEPDAVAATYCGGLLRNCLRRLMERGRFIFALPILRLLTCGPQSGLGADHPAARQTMRRIDVRAAVPMNWPCLDAMLLAPSVCKAPLYSAEGGRAIALATAAATGCMPALMAAVFGETRVSARVAKNQKVAPHVAGQGEPIGTPPVSYLMRLVK
jgi:hypothetical protein